MRILLLTLAWCLAIPNAVQAAGIPDSIAAAVASNGRSAADRERDEKDQPAALMAFAGVRPGMTVADIFGGDGYWSELFALAVGPEGHVDLVNNVGYFHYVREGLKARFADGRMESITRHVVESCDLELGQARVDLAVIFMSYHDLYYVDPASGWPRIDASGFLEQVHAAIKPGGYLLIVDHAAVAGSGNASAQDLHRIDERYAQADIESHGFELERTWDGYRHPADDLTKPVFDPTVRGKTDRFAHLYRRPQEGT